jgi:phosphopantetheine adenylyltransferase
MQKHIIVLFPGSFKPLTSAHIELIKRYALRPDVKQVKVMIGSGIRNGIDHKLALRIAKQLLKDVDKASIELTQYASPLLSAYKYIETASPGVYTLASSSKDSDYERVHNFILQHDIDGKYYKVKPKDVKVVELPVNYSALVYTGRNDKYEGKPISASILRNDVITNQYDKFVTNYPGYNSTTLSYIWNILKQHIH